ncbi:MAG: metal-sensing transcriptional repressor [Clostridiales bacterium]|nr:metal-sensing transcriptional repressor [Clostridiales bacterium]
MTADREQIARLLKTARGQLDGILRMIDEDRYCIDISNQIMATQSILSRANAEVLKSHVHHCVHAAVQSGDADKELEEISTILEKLAKR